MWPFVHRRRESWDRTDAALAAAPLADWLQLGFHGIPTQLHRRRGRSEAAYRGGGGQGHAVLVVTRLRGAASVTGAGGLSADGARRSDGQRGEDDGAEPLTLGPGQAGHCWEDKRRWSGRAAGLGRPRKKERKGGPVLRVERFHHFFKHAHK